MEEWRINNKQDFYLVLNRPNWLLAIKNNNCNYLKLTTETVH